MQKILFIEDNLEFGNFLTKSLESSTRSVRFLDNPLKGLEELAKEDFDLLITDLNLPTFSGVTLAKSAKNIQPNLRIIILTGEPTEDSELESIHYNVDLYIDKSKGVKVISEYIDSLLSKRPSEAQPKVLYSKSENIVLNITEHSVTKDDETFSLTPIEFRILTLFLQNMSRVITREEVASLISENCSSNSRTIDVHMKNLRSKLSITSISTIYGMGFKWNEE